MNSAASVDDPATGAALRAWRSAGRWIAGWWRVLHLGALLLALALSPASYRRDNRSALLRQIDAGTSSALLSFSVITLLISLVLIRIVLVTALGYGLSQYALEMVVRVLVLELIPLTAALYAALRCTIPNAVAVAGLRTRGGWSGLMRDPADPLRLVLLPRVAAGMFCALMLAGASCVVTLVVAYLSVYGFNTSGFTAYTHTVGRVFDASVSLVFGLKIVLFSASVALMPIASVLDGDLRGGSPAGRASAELRGLVRMFLVLLVVEAASLVGNYS